MDKVRIEVKIPEDIKVDYYGTAITVTPFLTLEQQAFLIKEYIKDFFKDTEFNTIPEAAYGSLDAECNLRNYVLQLATDVDTDNLDNNIYADSYLWSLITGAIENYLEFSHRLIDIVYDIKEKRNSVAFILDELIEKLKGAIDKMADMNPETIEKLRVEGLNLIERLEESSVLGNPKKKE